ncbi:MAG: thioredoxin-disulfide reductase [Candidatus Nezhaarchaeota archaeon]|nr:thioredoxin-disulfide reductase [Candidatus Nezhaarchaeota archaeon]
MAAELLDVVIVGSGPAGLTAAIYCARSGLKVQVIGKTLGGQAAEASTIENYPGFKHITGIELMERFREHVESLGINILNDEVVGIEEFGGVFLVKTSWSGHFKCRALILAIGAEPKKLGIKGEEEFRGKGVSYCAVCDGPLFRGRNVAVIGGGNSALDAAVYLSALAKTVYLVHRRGELRAAQSLIERLNSRNNVVKKLNKVPIEIGGERFVEWIKLKDASSGAEELLNVNAVFVEAGREVRGNFLKGFVALDDKGQIVVDALCRTSREGVFAAGDATITPYKQVIIAAGDGAKAALSAYEYLKGRGP